ncbi:MAG: anti-sigma factor antagonist, partial [Ruminococcus sp.]|nr:anti-sigma factor antagonist [Ruminococcus sp.]
MPVSMELDGDKLTAHLNGDIDHHTAAGMRSEIDRALRENCIKLLTLDFSGVTFMDSSGIGLVMGRHKLVTELGGSCRVADPPAYISKVMRISGI